MSIQPIHKNTRIYKDPSSSDVQLDTLISGLSCAIFLDVLKNAHTHARSTTNNNAENAYGVYVWQHGIRALRDATYNLGCVKNSQHGRELLIKVNSEDTVSIALMRSTKGLCKSESLNQPTNKNPRGKKFQEMILIQNKETAVLPLFNDLKNQRYWVLLHDYTDGVITAELVCPISMSSNGKYMNEYSTRIFIGSVNLNDHTSEIISKSPKSPKPNISLSRKRA